MRWYKIVAGGHTWDATGDPYALDVNLDIQATAQAAPGNGALVKIWGVGLPLISQAQQFYNQQCQVYGGMQKGLPLASQQAANAGLLCTGIILRPFGVYQGLEQTLNFILAPGKPPNGVPGPVPKPPNNHYVLDWKKGTPLAGALQQMFSQAGQTASINISQNIVATEDQPGYFPNLEQVAQFVLRWSQQIIGGQYEGVQMFIDPAQQIIVADTPTGGSSNILITDLVGQPCWIDQVTIQFRTVMRADIQVNSRVTLPQTWINSTGAGVGPVQQAGLGGQSITITSVRHVGSFRQPSGDSWITIFEGVTTIPD